MQVECTHLGGKFVASYQVVALSWYLRASQQSIQFETTLVSSDYRNWILPL